MRERLQSTDSGSSPTYDSSPDTSIQDSIDRTNQQMANDAANAAAQQQFLAGMAAGGTPTTETRKPARIRESGDERINQRPIKAACDACDFDVGRS